MVVTSEPSFMIASVMHELIRLPSTSTVQAPHCPWSHPFLVPVRSRFIRRRSSRVVQGSTCNSLLTPFTVNVILVAEGREAVCAFVVWVFCSTLITAPAAIGCVGAVSSFSFLVSRVSVTSERGFGFTQGRLRVNGE